MRSMGLWSEMWCLKAEDVQPCGMSGWGPPGSLGREFLKAELEVELFTWLREHLRLVLPQAGLWTPVSGITHLI